MAARPNLNARFRTEAIGLFTALACMGAPSAHVSVAHAQSKPATTTATAADTTDPLGIALDAEARGELK